MQYTNVKNMHSEQLNVKQSELIGQIQAYEEEIKNRQLNEKKMLIQFEQQNQELSELKNAIIELATVATSKNVTNTLNNLNYSQKDIH